ncbi:MAG: hypothetical protein JXQ73_18775 [Phycisphaerae bacterium]|nr:hypothetical protein [Phycisphaerae bacterium]
MKRMKKQLAMLLVSGAVMLQTTSCIDTFSAYLMDAFYTEVANNVVLDLFNSASSSDSTTED